MWRWSWKPLKMTIKYQVFSTYVEVILKHYINLSKKISFLHVCGGDPMWVDVIGLLAGFSPRMWRWSYTIFVDPSASKVFSTYVEVILDLFLQRKLKKSFLHVCGGDPKFRQWQASKLLFSPRMWRWSSIVNFYPSFHFVFSTYVEVILIWITN